jgi:hypothetical protein
MRTFRKLDLFNDYPELQTIWENSPMKAAPALETLPNEGVVVEGEDGEIIGALFIYLTSNSYNAILGYPVLDAVVQEDRHEVVERMYDIAESMCTYWGFRYINTWTPLGHVESRLNERGYKTGDVGVKHMIKIL